MTQDHISQIDSLRGSRGVYGIFNRATEGVYIGSSARDMGERLARNLRDLRQKIHGCHNLQKAWDDSDPADFEIVALWKAPQGATRAEIRAREEDTRLEYGDKTYNIRSASYGRANIDGKKGLALSEVAWADPVEVKPLRRAA